MKNIKNSVEKKEKSISKDPSFVRINVFDSIDANNDEFSNAKNIFSNKLILNNLNEQNILRSSNNINMKAILFPSYINKFNYNSGGIISNKNKVKAKFIHKEIRIIDKNTKNQAICLDTNCSNNINSFNRLLNINNNKNNFFQNQTSAFNNNSQKNNFQSSLKNQNKKLNGYSRKKDNYQTEENPNLDNLQNKIKNMDNPIDPITNNNYFRANAEEKNVNKKENKFFSIKKNEIKESNIPKRRNLSDIPSKKTRKANFIKVFAEQEGKNEAHGKNIQNKKAENDINITEKFESYNSPLKTMNNNTSENNNQNSENNSSFNSYKNENNFDEKDINKSIKNKNILFSVDSVNQINNSKNKDYVSNSSKSLNDKNNEDNFNRSDYSIINDINISKSEVGYSDNKSEQKKFSLCTNFNSNKTNTGTKSAKKNLHSPQNFHSNKTSKNNINIKNSESDFKSSPIGEGIKHSNFSSNINWRSQSQSKINLCQNLNQRIENIYDIKIDAKYDQIFESKVTKIDEELKENKYFDNIKFNYMLKNFNRFKDFIQKPPVIIKPTKTTSVPHQIFYNELKVSILKKLKNAMLKKEIQNQNFY